MVLHSAATELFEYRPLPELFDKIMNLIFETVGPERCAILLLEGDPPEAGGEGLAQPAGPADRERQPVDRAPGDRGPGRRCSSPTSWRTRIFSAQDSILSTGIRSAICAPLWYARSDGGRDAVIGLIYLDSMIGSRSFDDEDLYIVTALANVAAARIENARLLEESLEKRRMEDDMRVASEIQRGLLPQCAPAVPGYSLCGVNFPCRTVGGDYFDFELDNGDLLFALGDVSGKGTGAALLMTMLRASVRAHWTEGSLSHGGRAHQPHGRAERARQQVHHLLHGPPGAADGPPDLRERRPQPADAGPRDGRGRDAGRGRHGARPLRLRPLRRRA